MKFVGEPKKKAEKAIMIEEGKETIKKPGIELTEEELEEVAG